MANESAAGPGGHPGDGPVRYECRGDESPSVAVVEAVADVTGRDPADLPVLERALDTDALNAIVAHADGATRISFTYDGVNVVVGGDGGVAVWTNGPV